MSSYLKKLATRLARAWRNNEHHLEAGLGRMIDTGPTIDQATQVLLRLQYQEILHRGGPYPSFDDVEFRAYSQNGEDGILLYIFSMIGTTNKRAVEACVDMGFDCNAANLIINHGWEGLLFEGRKERLAMGRKFFEKCRGTMTWPPKLVHAWITRENINDLIKKHGYEGEIDLFSLDIDGVDYWIWKELAIISPRVVVVECQDIWGPVEAKTVPYDSKFQTVRTKWGSDYGGASLPAFVKLGKEKGYRLIGTQRFGFNAFFLRNDIGQDIFPEKTPAECLTHPRVKFGMKHRLPKVRNMPWEDV